MINKTIEVTPGVLWGATTALAAIVGTTAYVTWEVRKDYVDDLKRQVETYEKSNTWKLPETLSSIKLASDQLVLNMTERNELTELRKGKESLTAQVKQLKDQFDTASAKLILAESELAQISIPSTVIDLIEGESKFIIENSVNLALRSAMTSQSYIRLANKDRVISLGETIEYQAGAKICKLTLLKGGSSGAKFQNACA